MNGKMKMMDDQEKSERTGDVLILPKRRDDVK